MLGALLRYLEQHGTPKIKLPKVGTYRQRTNTATREQIDAMLRGAPVHMRLFILLCWQLALRFNEAMHVTPRFWNEESNTITIEVKGGKTRTLPLTPEITSLLGATRHGDPDESCVSILYGKPIAPETVRSNFYRIQLACGLTNLTPHDLRRTTATALYEASKDLRAVQQYLGHSDMTSTLRYLAPLKEEQLRDYHKILRFEQARHTQKKKETA